MKGRAPLLTIAALLLARPALACKCSATYGVCGAVATSNVIFIGTVESVEPKFLDRWNPAGQPSMAKLNEANERFLQNGSAANLGALKDQLRSAFPDLPDEGKKRLESANSHDSLVKLFSYVLDHGKRTRFRVRTVFRNGDDDDDSDDDTSDDQTFDVWTQFGDCGYDFQEGETYLVFAGNDEETNIMETDSCSRTRRLSDAGPDLAYLYFSHDHDHPSGRVEGFTTFDLMYQLQQAVPFDPDRIASPAAGIVVELKSEHWRRYATTDASGHYIFDGLDAGDYQVSGYAAGFPDTVKLLTAAPKTARVAERGCASQVLVIPKPAP